MNHSSTLALETCRGTEKGTGAFWLLLGLAAIVMPNHGIADTIYVSGGSPSSAIYKLDSSGASSVFATNGLSNPQGLAVDTIGNLYVANGPSSGGTILRFTPSGTGSVFASNGLSFPFGLAFDIAGNLFVANNNNRTIEKITPGAVATQFASLGGANEPRGLAFDASGNLFVAYGNAIAEFTPGGVGTLFATNNGLNHPQGLAFDKAGNLYAANFANNTIEKFTADGTGSLFANTGLSGPEGLAFDSSGLLYVANRSNGTIYRFAPDGTGELFASGITNPNYITIVPEPGTPALLGVALLALCFPLRQNRARQRNAPAGSPCLLQVAVNHNAAGKPVK